MTHLRQEPDRALWLNDLFVVEYPDLIRQRGDVDRMREHVRSQFGGPRGRNVLKDIIAVHGDEPEVWLHLLLLGAFLEKKRSEAIDEVCEAHLSPAELSELRYESGQLDRRSAAMLLLHHSPDYLRDLVVADLWQARRRCSFEIHGPARRLPDDLDWWEIAGDAIGRLAGDGGLVSEDLLLMTVFPRAGEREQIIGYRDRGRRAAVRADDGDVQPGHEDEWLVLRFYRGGNHVDVTGDADLGLKLAQAVGLGIWQEPVRYTDSRDGLLARDLRDFLARVTDPLDNVFQLLEIVAEVPGLPERPIIQLSNNGQIRVETSVRAMQASLAFAMDWRRVYRVKLGFAEQLRVEVHFPPPDGELVLSYSDLDRSKAAMERFEALFERELGVVIKPRAKGESRRLKRQSPAPRGRGPGFWNKLLEPVHDAPELWRQHELRELAALGLIELEGCGVFGCSDPHLPEGLCDEDTLDCPGEVEVKLSRPEPDALVEVGADRVFKCGHAGHAWHPRGFRLPFAYRLRVRPSWEGWWAQILLVLNENAEPERRFVEVEPGYASGWFARGPVEVVFLPLVGDVGKLSVQRAAVVPCCWVGPKGPMLARYGERGVNLGDVLSQKRKAFGRVFRQGLLEATAPLGPAPVRRPEPERRPVAPPVREVTAATVEWRNNRPWVYGQPILAAQATSSILILAVLAHFAEEDERRAGGGPPEGARQMRTSGQLRMGLNRWSGEQRIPSDDLPGEQELERWLTRARQSVEKNRGSVLAKALIQGGAGRGFRLGPKFTWSGPELSDAMKNWIRRTKK
ncbi:MAG: hypothetical protein H6741_35095 [Alphaproteobacteria bacterium]|nr:hypothetical protein [Alphaproteobacteria bacterium]